MTQPDSPSPPNGATTHGTVRLRLLSSLLALSLGVTAIMIALLLLRSALG
jgi:hypothetical protein